MTTKGRSRDARWQVPSSTELPEWVQLQRPAKASKKSCFRISYEHESGQEQLLTTTDRVPMSLSQQSSHVNSCFNICRLTCQDSRVQSRSRKMLEPCALCKRCLHINLGLHQEVKRVYRADWRGVRAGEQLPKRLGDGRQRVAAGGGEASSRGWFCSIPSS